MPCVVYLGDAVSAAGYRLAGATVRTPGPGEAGQALAWALGQASLVLISAELAVQIDEALLRRAQLALQPLLLVVPDLIGGAPAPDLAARLRAQLGMEVAE